MMKTTTQTIYRSFWWTLFDHWLSSSILAGHSSTLSDHHGLIASIGALEFDQLGSIRHTSFSICLRFTFSYQDCTRESV